MDKLAADQDGGTNVLDDDVLREALSDHACFQPLPAKDMCLQYKVLARMKDGLVDFELQWPNVAQSRRSGMRCAC